MIEVAVPLTIWIPLRKPIFDWDRQINGYLDARDKFLKQVPSTLLLIDERMSCADASIALPPENILDVLISKSTFATDRFVEYIRLEVVAGLDIEEIRSQNEGNYIEDSFFPAFAAVAVLTALELVMALSELAFPGSINTFEGSAVAGLTGEILHTARAKTAFQSLKYPDEREPAWPEIVDIDLNRVVAWALGTSLNHKALGATRVERLLAAYTHIVRLTHFRHGEVLFRAMQGLEAFYCDGIGDLRKQLSDKAVLWLGRWSDKRNIVGHLYDLRSQFVHGAASIEYMLDRHDPWEEDEKLMNNLVYGVGFSVRLVIATLQRCIERNVYNVKWSYSVEEQ